MALLYALAGVARAGATRSGYVSGQVFVQYGGVHYGWGHDTAAGILVGSLSINQELDETPDTGRFTVNGIVPSIGDEVIITLGSKSATMPLFAGFGLTVTQKYAGVPANVQADVAAVDYTWQLGFVLVTIQYRNQSASAIVQDLVSRFAGANGFTATAVEAGMPTLDEITFTNEDLATAITRTLRRAGGYWYCDYRRNVHAFVNAEPTSPPLDLTPTHPSLANVTQATERTQVLSRVYVEGRGSRLLGNVATGDTKIPLDAVDMFAVAPDVFLKASFQGAEGGAQHLAFSGVVVGGAGSVVGPGMGPTTAPTVALGSGSGVTPGTHSYAITFATASGESMPGPQSTISVGGQVSNPTGLPGTPYNAGTHFLAPSLTIGDTIYAGYAYSTATSSTDAANGLQTTAAVTHPTGVVVISGAPLNPTQAQAVGCAFPYSGDANVKWIVTFWNSAQRPGWYRYNVIANNAALVGGYAQEYVTLYNTVVGLPASNTTSLPSQVLVSSIATGPSGTTSRKLYRTAAGQAPLKLLATLADNTTTTYTDAIGDGSLGATPPATDTSGLTQPQGQVLPGSTVLPIAGNAPFDASGGWAVIGNGDQVIRYTGVTSTQLTGIPASGTGSITATVVYNSTATAAAMLTGIPSSGDRSIVRALTAGDEIYLVVQVDDEPTRAALAADVGGTGLREEWVQDRRLSIPEARARGRATLNLRPLDTFTLSYTVRDLRTGVGKFVTATLPAPTNITGVYRIQSVGIGNFRPRANQYPTYRVRASSTHFSFDDWLRRLRTTEV